MQKPLGLILAGGQGRRMGGTSKAELRLGGARLIDLAEARLAPQVDAIAVSTNAALDTALPLLPDTAPGFLGPLAGILAGMVWAESQGATHLVSVAVDTPFFPCDLVPRLQWAAEEHPAGLAIATSGGDTHGTFGIWPVVLRTDLAAFLSGGGRKVRAWTEAQGAAMADFPAAAPSPFFNINTPEDLERAEGWA